MRKREYALVRLDRSNMAKTVRVIFLGGVGEIGKNMTALEYDDDIIIVDCGAEFPHDDSPGIDAIIPDVSYIRENLHKLRGIVLTHGHEDHIGAIQYYGEEFGVPVYGTALTLGLLARKLGEKNAPVKLVEVKEGDTATLGCFSVEFIKVAHSMAGACALSITTPLGVVFVTGDFKLDRSPIDNKKTNLKRIKEIGDQGVMLMLGESTNVERKGRSTSEKIVGQGLQKIFEENTDKRIVIACFASSNYRVQQILWLAEKFKRKVYLAGRSMKSIVDVASKVGEIKIPKGVIVDGVGKTQPEKLVIIATGTQGERDSALSKLSKDDFGKGISIGEKDVVVLSSTPIPGNEKSVYDVINNLFRQGAKVIYDSMNDVHVSGHAYKDELRIMLEHVRPKYFMPVHGEYRHQFKHVELAVDTGVDPRNTAIPNVGEVWGVGKGGLRQHSNVTAGNVYVDGDIIEDGACVVRDRRSLAEYGILIVLASYNTKSHHLDGDVEIIARGVNVTEEKHFDIVRAVNKAVQEDESHQLFVITGAVKKAVKKQFYRDRQFPIVIPVIVED